MYYKSSRNKAIVEKFDDFLRQGYPTMEAYAQTGKVFFLTEERIRKIIAQRHKWSNVQKKLGFV